MKWSFLLFSSFLCLQAIAQYPATGNKMRLGWQTTGDGLVYRGAIGDTATLDPSGINNAWMLLDTANGNLYAYRAKAWRLVSGGGGGVTMPFDSVTFNVNETDASLRELKYSEEKGYLQYGGQDSVQIPLLPGIWYVRNDTSVTIPKGTVLRATGTLGASGRIKVKHMIANGSIDAMYILGIAMQDIAVGADGYAMSQGKIRKINTQAYSEGAVLYADVDTLGGLTQTEPTGSNLKLPIAFVVNSASNGTIAVRVTSGAYMRDLHDAEITSPASNASLYYNAAQGIWRDTGAAVLVADTAAMLTNYINIADTATMLSSYISNADTSVFARDFQISGTTNYIPKFTGANTIGNSAIYEINKKILVNSTSSITTFNLPTIELHGNGSNPTTDQPIIAVSANNGNSAISRGYLNLNRSGGTTAGNTTLVPYDYFIGTLRWAATDGIESRSGAEISAITDSITGLSDMPTALTFATTANGAASPTERMRITSAGNVGIGTSSPSRPLHVAETTAIRIPVGNFAQRGTSDNGDIRVRTDTASMEYYSGAWRTVAPMARVPQSGLANRFSKFDADGLLDTSAVLVQSSDRIGIGNATPDSTLTVTGGIRATTGITAARFTATGSAVPTNGMYLPATNALAFSTNSTERMRILSDGKVGINVTPTEQLQVEGTVRAKRLSVNTFKTEVVSINNFAPSGLADGSGNNLWIGNGGQSSSWTTGGEGGGNLSIGRNALFANTRGGGNLAIGTSALASNTTGNVNIAIGAGAISNSAQENNSIAIGSYALQNNNNITGENIAIGFASMMGSTNGRYNVGIGASTLSSNNGGYEHIAIGRISLASNTSGIANTAIGYYSSAFNTTGSYNVAIGHFAGVYFGASTANLNETSSTSVYIGRDTRASANGNSNEIVIGDQGRGNGSNTTTIGNSSTTKTFFQYGETYIGTATDNGAYNLQVAGGSYLSGEIKYVNRPAAAAVTNVGVDANGVLREATSSQRFKDNITPYQKGLSDAMRLQAKAYTYKGDTTLQAGFIAEDVHEAGLTEYVNYDKEGKPYSLQYGNMVTLLLNAMKEQQAQIEALKKEIEALKNK